MTVIDARLQGVWTIRSPPSICKKTIRRPTAAAARAVAVGVPGAKKAGWCRTELVTDRYRPTILVKYLDKNFSVKY